ncbi:MAG: HTH domain-containing protein [Nanoarchaeota archaeon]|nr:HTH domain-containing protein [Nanoarchaeota archaeon]
MAKKSIENEIIKYLVKDLSGKQTVTYLAGELGISRVGIWKAVKRLESKGLVVLHSIGEGKTSVYTIKINFDNPVSEKMLALYLTEDALKYKRWIVNFQELEKEVDFLILYGSILKSNTEAKDIDILGVVSDKKRFIEINKIINKIQKTQIKKIHSITFTINELEDEIKKGNKAFIDGIKKGKVLFGQERFVRIMRDLL